mgnify:CR=1 FL=1
MKTITAFCDLAFCPVSYDFATWMVRAMAKRDRLKYDHLHIVNDREDLFSHSTMFVLADRQGLVRAFYSPLSDPKWLAKLTADLATLRLEPAR